VTLAVDATGVELENGQKPLHWGLLPKWAYGGDILDVLCYPIFPNLCCWRGLVDTAWVLDDQGDKETARRYRGEARAYRADIDRAIDGSYRQDEKPPFLPLKLYGTQPDENWIITLAGCLWTSKPRAGSRHALDLDYLETPIACLPSAALPAWDRSAGCHLRKGYWLGLHDDAIRVPPGLLRLPGLQHEHGPSFRGNQCSTERSASALGIPDCRHQRRWCVGAPWRCNQSAACSSPKNVGSGDYSGNLLLLSVRVGCRTEGNCLREMPTHFGPMSLETVSHTGKRTKPGSRRPSATHVKPSCASIGR
jgi:hypothetical protein